MVKNVIDESQDPGISRIPVVQKVTPVNYRTPLFNWLPDKIDKRDYIYQPNQVRLPSVVDLRSYCTPIEDQGSLGSCTGQAIAGAIEMLNKRNNKPTDVSRLFIYYYERLIEGTVNYDSGAYIRDGIKACYTYGAPLERLWPHDIGKFRTRPSESANIDAAQRKVTLYERATDFDACINALSNGYSVVVGFTVYTSFMTPIVYKSGIMPYPNTKKEKILGGHAVLLVGYDNTAQRFIARNSWGTSWGANGYFYMPFDVIKNTNMSADFWVIKSVDNP
jgi:C1A family cysteine protease